MKNWKCALSFFGAILVLAGCGGGGGDTSLSRSTFGGYVNFGDSLSDVGSYRVGTVAALKGGLYTINSDTALNWTAVVAKTYDLPAPCAAQTGLDGFASQGFSVPVTNVPNCFNYAQGGSRVTLQPGSANKLFGGSSAVIGQLTLPVKDQMSTHLAKIGGAYSGNELVTVFAGANDLFIQAGIFQATVAALIESGRTPDAAKTTAGNAAGLAMSTAAAELAGYVKTLVVGKGAKNVVVLNLPNVSRTPESLAAGAETQAFVNRLNTVFNDNLKQSLAGLTEVVLVDTYTESTIQADNPARYGLTNVRDSACGTNVLGGSALVCNASNLNPGDVSRYLYSDGVHPTPYGYELLAKFVVSAMIKSGFPGS